MTKIRHVGHNEYPIIPQIVTVDLVEVPKEGTVSFFFFFFLFSWSLLCLLFDCAKILFGSYLKYPRSNKIKKQGNERKR